MRWKRLLTAFKEAFKNLMINDPLRLAGATAFFATFALPAILVIVIQLLRLIFRVPRSGKRLFEQLEGIIGVETAHMVADTLQAIRGIAQNQLITTLGFVFLLFVATTLFKVISSSLNQLWSVRVVDKENFGDILLARLKGLLVICFIGVIFIIDLVASAGQQLIGRFIDYYVPALTGYFNSTLNYGLGVVTVTIWFALVFYFLPAGRPQRNVLFTGAFVTSILFNIGKLILRVALNYSSINNIYGASASTVLLLLFVFYTAMIFYFGAAFTKAWAEVNGQVIIPRRHAKSYKLTVVED
ncbi:YihY/virulence factor BrkB family protein [Chitinophaga sp. sic0106]|uniref:YihY/virulence factor BrkB family protein n=1 Tax=Chitinophaga sp. sic0106 TaxID=2854785 RepID=UPI001C44A5B8|nr:YihY/virulence factor BrkB family protein [Chitinophaga sp. sic0106]MBV7529118.1 YihY/virulence factor BrkB family protein [Chitinophaga sp. sic0106]